MKVRSRVNTSLLSKRLGWASSSAPVASLAWVKIAMASLAYNMRRLLWLDTRIAGA
jgi:hypothetical protein